MIAPAQPVELQIEVAQLSDPGRDPNKQVNEDSSGYAHTKLGHLCVLCDGMGGHYGGQEASRRAIATIFEEIERAPQNASPAQALKNAIEVAGRKVYELGGPPENKVRPGSTVVAMLLHDGGVDVAHVGDSRAYMVRSGQIYPVTRDHSMVQAMIDSGFITEEQAIGHPDANKITRALGMKPDVDVDLRPEPMELFPGDILLTTSDGLTDLALSKDILGALRQALASGGLDHACQQLVRMANDRGGHDNITVQLVRITSTARKKTQVGATAPGTSPAAGPFTPSRPPMWAGGATQLAQAQAAGPAPGGQPVQPTSVDTLLDPRAPQHTYPMQPGPTAHDGTSRAQPTFVMQLPPGFAPGQPGGHAGQPAAPPAPQASAPGAVQPTVVHGVAMGTGSSGYGAPAHGSHGHAAHGHAAHGHAAHGHAAHGHGGPGLSGYNLAGPAGLALPPPSVRPGNLGPYATPAMTPTPGPVGVGAPGAQGMPTTGPSHDDPWAMHRHGGPATAGDDPQNSGELQRGSSVLYLVLGASFGVAVALLLLVWHFLLRR
jgi:protein phosphatase